MKKYKPYSADWPISLKTLAQALNRDNYTSRKQSGFIVDQARKNAINARFIEKLMRVRTVTDPFGQKTDERLVDFHVTEMQLKLGPVGLELINPGRSSKLLVASLNSVMQEFVAISAVAVNLHEWSRLITEQSSSDYVISQLRMTGVRISAEVVANISVKGSRNLQKSVDKYFSGSSGCVDRIALERLGRPESRIIISSDGSFEVADEFPKKMLDTVVSSRDQLIN